MPVRGSVRSKIPAGVTLAAANDLDGDATTLDVSGTDRVLIVQLNNGTNGTAGIDTIETSNDNGASWRADPTIIALASDDVTAPALTNAVLNAAGVEPTAAAIFKSGPHNGPTLMRCSRLASQDPDSAAWVTGAPQVLAIMVG